MKGKLAVSGIVSLFFFSKCAVGIDDANTLTSKSIEESQKNGSFISKYSFEQSPAGLFDVEEAWQEIPWHYKVKNIFKFEKVDNSYGTSWILFTVKNSSKYDYKNFPDWLLVEKGTTKYVGCFGGRFAVSLDDRNSPDSVVLELLNPHSNNEKMGTVILRRQ